MTEKSHDLDIPAEELQEEGKVLESKVDHGRGLVCHGIAGGGSVLWGLGRRCVPKGAGAAWNTPKPTTVPRGSMAKLEADPKENGKNSPGRPGRSIVSKP